MPLPGDFGLVSIKGYVGKLIRVGQWLNGNGYRNYEHAFLVLDDGTVYEAEPHGSRIAPLSEYSAADVVYSDWPLTDKQRSDIVAVARASVGTPYSVLDYFAIALHRFRIPAPWLHRYIASRKHEICSQAVDRVYHAAGIELFTDKRWPGYVSPASLYDVLHAAK